MKNYNRKSGKYVQDTGKETLERIPKRIAAFLGLDPQNFAFHSFRRSAANELVNSGASMVQLQQAGSLFIAILEYFLIFMQF